MKPRVRVARVYSGARGGMDTEHRYIRHKGAGRRSASGSTVHSCIFVENYSISIRVHVDVDVDVYNVDAVLREEKET